MQASNIVPLVLSIYIFHLIWKHLLTILLFAGAWYVYDKQSLIQWLTSLLSSCKDRLKQMVLTQMKKVFPASLSPSFSKRFVSRGMTALLREVCTIGQSVCKEIRGQFGRAEDDESQGETDDDDDDDTDDDDTDDDTDDDPDGELQKIPLDYNKLLNPAPSCKSNFVFLQFNYQKEIIDDHLKDKPAETRNVVKDFYTAWNNSEEAKAFNPTDLKEVWYKTYCDFYNDYCQTHPNFVQTCQNIFGPN